jgi:hypothetical protein
VKPNINSIDVHPVDRELVGAGLVKNVIKKNQTLESPY